MRPNLVHLDDVETFKGLVESLIGVRNGFDALFQHTAPLRQRSRIILQENPALREYFATTS